MHSYTGGRELDDGVSAGDEDASVSDGDAGARGKDHGVIDSKHFLVADPIAARLEVAATVGETECSAQTGVDVARSRRRHIPNEVRRQVVERDGGCCAFVGKDGRCCGSRIFLQVHHEVAFARGGGETVENLRLLCAAHNRLLAETDFGKAWVSDSIAARRRGE